LPPPEPDAEPLTWVPDAVSANQPAPNAVMPWPLVSPAFWSPT
jgi:hypothetical protein